MLNVCLVSFAFLSSDNLHFRKLNLGQTRFSEIRKQNPVKESLKKVFVNLKRKYVKQGKKFKFSRLMNLLDFFLVTLFASILLCSS